MAGGALSYEYEGEGGRSLKVVPSVRGGRAVVTADEVRVDPLSIPEITAAMCRACGQEPPVMLGRPDIDPGRPAVAGEVQVWKEPDGRVGFMPADPEFARVTGALRLAPHAVRQLAAVAVAYADAGVDPGMAEVEELAEAIRLEVHPASGQLGLRPAEADRAAARAALRWMRDRGVNRGQ